MKQQPKLQWLTWLFALFALLAIPVQAVEKQQIILQPPSLEGEKFSLQWWVEGLKDQTVTDAELLMDGAVVAAQPQLEPARGQSVCYMLMVDTSQSMVTNGGTITADGLKALLKGIVEAKPALHSLGLMTFAKQATLIAKPTQDKVPLLAAIGDLKFDQPRTELFRFIENGIKELEQCPANYRRVLVLVSDGVAEDKSYDEADAVKFAQENHTSIYSFVVKDSSSLQNPIYLAEKTGGWGSEPASHNPQNRANTIAKLYMGSNSGGDLQAVIPSGQVTKGAQLRLTLSDGKNLTTEISLKIDSAPQLPVWKKKLLEWFPWLTANQLDYVLWGLGLLLLLLSRVAYRASRPHPLPYEAPRDPVGFLVRHGQTFPVYPGINSVGFLPTNNIVIDDETVGRAHATLHYQGDGDVVMTDLNSLNGSYVNDNRIQRPTSIHDGDSITFGEWKALYQQAEQAR